MEPQFIKRLKSFAWRFGAYIVVASLAWVSANLGLLELSAPLTAFIAYIIGEVTKYLNTPPTHWE